MRSLLRNVARIKFKMRSPIVGDMIRLFSAKKPCHIRGGCGNEPKIAQMSLQAR